MSNIDIYLQDILNAVYGEQVRQAIHDAIKEIAREASIESLKQYLPVGIVESSDPIVQIVDAAIAASLSVKISGSGTISLWHCGRNLCKVKDGSYNPNNRNIIVSNGVVKTTMTNTVGSTNILPESYNIFDSTFFIPAGSYIWNSNGEYDEGIYIGSLHPKLLLKNSAGTSISVNEGAFTIDSPHCVAGIINDVQINLPAGKTFFLSPQIEYSNSLGAFEPFRGEYNTVPVLSGIADFTRFTTMFSGVDNLIPSSGSTYCEYLIRTIPYSEIIKMVGSSSSLRMMSNSKITDSISETSKNEDVTLDNIEDDSVTVEE